MIAVGVPETAPVEVSKERPVGREGVIDQLVMVPPLFAGVVVVIDVPFVRVNESGL